RSVHHFSWPCSWHRASHRSGRHCLLHGFRSRHGHVASRGHCLRDTLTLASRPDCRASRRLCHCPDRLRFPGSLHMTRLFVLALTACLFILTTPASAHAPIMGIGGVLGGFLHALLIPEHGMSLVALGLALGRQETLARRYGLLIFTAAVTIGLLVVGLGVDAPFSGDVLLAATGLLGLSVAFAW